MFQLLSKTLQGLRLVAGILSEDIDIAFNLESDIHC